MSDTRRIARNTLMLYFRQILIMLVSLYTVRVVLNVLGAEDYGIYGVVAGVVVLFSFVNNAMANSTQRFLNYAFGEKNIAKVREVYSASILIHFFIALLFLILAETIGLWFVSCKLNFPSERHFVAMIVYHFAIVTTVFNIFRVPYNAIIIAYEKMSFFAVLSIFEAVLKLVIVFLISIVKIDRLVFYSVLLSVVSILISFVYKIYCNAKFETAHFEKVRNIELVKELFSFSGWNLFGASANVANQQGTNIVINVFTNVTVNAAMGIANQINSAVYSFVSNFQTAFNPQLVKTYAAGEKDEFMLLLCRTAKFSFFLLLFIFVPLYVNIDYVLFLWLKNVPRYSVDFVRLILIWSLIDSLNGPLWVAAAAQGDIRKYQIIAGILIFLNLPLSILFLSLEFSPLWILYIRIGMNVVMTFWRIFYLNKKVSLKIADFMKRVLLPCIIVFVLSFYSILLFSLSFVELKRLLITVPASIAIVFILIFVIGLSHTERNYVFSYVSNRWKK